MIESTIVFTCAPRDADYATTEEVEVFTTTGFPGTIPQGKAQEALMADMKDWPSRHSELLSDVAKGPAFRGIHFAKILSAAEALAKKGLVTFDGAKITKNAVGLASSRPQTWRKVVITNDRYRTAYQCDRYSSFLGDCTTRDDPRIVPPGKRRPPPSNIY